MYGECEEGEDPQVTVKTIMDGFDRLNKTGYRDLAISTLDEAALALKLAGYLQGRKTAYRARQDGDWETLSEGIAGCQSYDELMRWEFDNRQKVSRLPADWLPHLREIFDRQKEALKRN